MSPSKPFDTGAAALDSVPNGERDGDLSPPQWRAERLRGERRERVMRRVLLGAAVYAGIVAAGVVVAGHHESFRSADSTPGCANCVPWRNPPRPVPAHWKTLAPAIDWTHYLAESLKQVCECLPPGDTVRLTTFDEVGARHFPARAKHPSAAAAVEFTEKLRTRAGTQDLSFRGRPAQHPAERPRAVPRDRQPLRPWPADPTSLVRVLRTAFSARAPALADRRRRGVPRGEYDRVVDAVEILRPGAA